MFGTNPVPLPKVGGQYGIDTALRSVTASDGAPQPTVLHQFAGGTMTELLLED